MGNDRAGGASPGAPDVAARAQQFVTAFLDHVTGGPGSPQGDAALQTLSRAGKPEVEAATRLLDEALLRWAQSVDAAASMLQRSLAVVGQGAKGSLDDGLQLTSEAADLLLRAGADVALHQHEISTRLARIEAYASLCAAIERTSSHVAAALEQQGDAHRGAALRAGPARVASQRGHDLAEVGVVLSQGVAGLELGRRSAVDLRDRLVRAQSLIASALAGESAAQAVAGARAALQEALISSQAVRR